MTCKYILFKCPGFVKSVPFSEDSLPRKDDIITLPDLNKQYRVLEVLRRVPAAVCIEVIVEEVVAP
jgi:hypothetical protein